MAETARDEPNPKRFTAQHSVHLIQKHNKRERERERERVRVREREIKSEKSSIKVDGT